MREVRPHIRHPSRHMHARTTRERLDRRCGMSADHVELRVRQAGSDQRQHVGGEPRDRIHVRRVVHRPGEDEVRHRRVERRRMRLGRIEVAEVDPAADCADLVRLVGNEAREQRRLRRGDEAREVALGRDPALERGDVAPLTSIDQAHRAARGRGIGAPFLGIDVGEIHQAWSRARQVEHVGRHVGGVHEHGRTQLRHDAPHPVLQAPVAEEYDAQGLAGQQPAQAGEPRAAAIERGDVEVATEPTHRVHVRPVGRIVDQAAEMHVVPLAQPVQDVQRPYLLALDRRIGQALRQEQERWPAHPRPRTKGGPSRLASASGRRFQAAMNSRYFGLSGLWSGIAAPGASR